MGRNIPLRTEQQSRKTAHSNVNMNSAHNDMSFISSCQPVGDGFDSVLFFSSGDRLIIDYWIADTRRNTETHKSIVEFVKVMNRITKNEE